MSAPPRREDGATPPARGAVATALAVCDSGLERHLLGRRLTRAGFARVDGADPWAADAVIAREAPDVVVWAAGRHEALGRRLMHDARAAGAAPQFLLVLEEGAAPSRAAAALRAGWDDAAAAGAPPGEVVARAHAGARRAAEAAAAAGAAAAFRELVEDGRDILARLRPDGVLLYVSRSVEQALGHRPGDLAGRDFLGLCHADDREALRSALEADGDGPGVPAPIRHRARRRDGGLAWLETVVRTVRDRSGRTVEVRTDSREITDRVRMETERAALGRVTAAIARTADLDALLHRVAAEAACVLGVATGAVVRFHGDEGLVVGGFGALRAGDAVPLPALDGLSVAAPIAVEGRAWGVLTARGPTPGALGDHDAERLRRFADLAAVAIANAESRERLHALASTDALTGLANHRVLHERLVEEVARARRGGTALSLIVMDLDRFKLVNDTHGHQVGDEVLRKVAHRLASGARAGDTVARIGGEEMAWLLPNAGLEDALQAAERLRAQVAAEPFGALGRLTASFGIAALGPGDGPADLLRRADVALYRAKEAGRDRCVAFPDDLVTGALSG